METMQVVGALISDERHRIFVQRRSLTRRLFPGVWDVVGGHIESGETPREALAREVEEETGWTLRRVEAVVAEWEWEHEGVLRHELDYLVEVDGDLRNPRLEDGKHDAIEWVGPQDLDMLIVGRDDGDRRLRDIVAKAARTRITDRLRLEPVGSEHADDLSLIQRGRTDGSDRADRAGRVDHVGRAVARDYEAVRTDAEQCGLRWERDGVHHWIAYERQSGDPVGRGGLSRNSGNDLQLDWIPRADLHDADRHDDTGYAAELEAAALRFAFDELGADRVHQAGSVRFRTPGTPGTLRTN